MRAGFDEGSDCSPADGEDRETDCSSQLLMSSVAEKAPEVAESSASDDKTAKDFPVDPKSPTALSHDGSFSDEDPIKILTEKLSTVLRDVRCKEDLAKQHAKVAEEAVSGWEKAEKEVATLKLQLELALQNTSALGEKVTHLDSALKECVRELRQSREEHTQKSSCWELEKNGLKAQISELEALIETEKEASTSVGNGIQMKLEAMEKENEYLKSELLAQSEELNIRTLERELSTQAAEIASKQHLESIKKVTKLESECLRLRARACKKSSNDHKLITAPVSVNSQADSLSDNGDRFIGLDPEPSCSDSWASALIVELDQFKGAGLNPSGPSPEIDLMDDFVQMEKFAALTETAFDGPPSETSMNAAGLEEKIRLLEVEKADMERLLSETQERLEKANNLLDDYQKELQRTEDSCRTAQMSLESSERVRKVLESQLEAAVSEVDGLREKIEELQRKNEEDMILSNELALKCRGLEDELLRRNQEAELARASVLNGELKLKQDKELAVAAGKLAECQKTIASLGQQLRSLANLENITMEEEGGGLNGLSSLPQQLGFKLHSNESVESPKSPDFLNGREDLQSPSSSSSSVSGPWRSVPEQGHHPHLHI
ncbi:filament-like plant protein isoform X2 [Wolffia australiana]